jgi:hypothetical protein
MVDTSEHDWRLIEPRHPANPMSPVFVCARCHRKWDRTDTMLYRNRPQPPCSGTPGRGDFHLIDVAAPHG